MQGSRSYQWLTHGADHLVCNTYYRGRSPDRTLAIYPFGTHPKVDDSLMEDNLAPSFATTSESSAFMAGSELCGVLVDEHRTKIRKYCLPCGTDVGRGEDKRAGGSNSR